MNALKTELVKMGFTQTAKYIWEREYPQRDETVVALVFGTKLCGFRIDNSDGVKTNSYRMYGDYFDIKRKNSESDKLNKFKSYINVQYS